MLQTCMGRDARRRRRRPVPARSATDHRADPRSLRQLARCPRGPTACRRIARKAALRARHSEQHPRGERRRHPARFASGLRRADRRPHSDRRLARSAATNGLRQSSTLRSAPSETSGLAARGATSGVPLLALVWPALDPDERRHYTSLTDLSASLDLLHTLPQPPRQRPERATRLSARTAAERVLRAASTRRGRKAPPRGAPPLRGLERRRGRAVRGRRQPSSRRDGKPVGGSQPRRGLARNRRRYRRARHTDHA